MVDLKQSYTSKSILPESLIIELFLNKLSPVRNMINTIPAGSIPCLYISQEYIYCNIRKLNR